MLRPLSLLSLLLLALAPLAARANERHFTYSYETAVLPPGAREIEMWTTLRAGRDAGRYVAFEHRGEFELGLTDRLQTSLYLNFSTVSQEVVPGQLATSTRFDSVSNEWKLKLMDPVADAVGLGLYGEVALGPEEAELELKLLLDKRVGPLLLVGNLVLENELEFELEETEPEFAAELTLGATWFFTPGFSAGVEVRSVNAFPEGEGWRHSALYAGPVVAYAQPGWWVALSVMPQLPALKKPEGTSGSRILDEQEKLNARLLFSFAL